MRNACPICIFVERIFFPQTSQEHICYKTWVRPLSLTHWITSRETWLMKVLSRELLMLKMMLRKALAITAFSKFYDKLWFLVTTYYSCYRQSHWQKPSVLFFTEKVPIGQGECPWPTEGSASFVRNRRTNTALSPHKLPWYFQLLPVSYGKKLQFLYLVWILFIIIKHL